MLGCNALLCCVKRGILAVIVILRICLLVIIIFIVFIVIIINHIAFFACFIKRKNSAQAGENRGTASPFKRYAVTKAKRASNEIEKPKLKPCLETLPTRLFKLFQLYFVFYYNYYCQINNKKCKGNNSANKRFFIF